MQRINFNDYIVYIDESGDHCLTDNDPEYPVFVLAFCVFRKDDYANLISPTIKKFKFKYFGHDAVILHENSIRMQRQPFTFLQNRERRSEFMRDIDSIISSIPMTVIATVINKREHTEKYPHPANPYSLSLLFCMERLQMFLKDNSQDTKSIHLIFECRGEKEDSQLEAEFRAIQKQIRKIRAV